MERTTSKKLARARLLESRAAAAAERERRERANIGDLAEFVVQTAKVDEVDEWLAARVQKAQAEAEERRMRHRLAAGKSLQAMRFRGETIASIALQAGVSQAKVREYLQLAAEHAREAGDGGGGGDNGGVVVPMPTAAPAPHSGRLPDGAVADAQ